MTEDSHSISEGKWVPSVGVPAEEDVIAYVQGPRAWQAYDWKAFLAALGGEGLGWKWLRHSALFLMDCPWYLLILLLGNKRAE